MKAYDDPVRFRHNVVIDISGIWAGKIIGLGAGVWLDNGPARLCNMIGLLLNLGEAVLHINHVTERNVKKQMERKQQHAQYRDPSA